MKRKELKEARSRGKRAREFEHEFLQGDNSTTEDQLYIDLKVQRSTPNCYNSIYGVHIAPFGIRPFKAGLCRIIFRKDKSVIEINYINY